MKQAYIKRKIESTILEAAKYFPVITVTGPRQSGKTTMLKQIFPHLHYYSLEDLDTRSFAMEDPVRFLHLHEDGMILDEVHNYPELLSYIQGIVDEQPHKKFVLSGSSNFALLKKVSQSLAGRSGVFELMPLSIEEVKGQIEYVDDADQLLYQGLYPAVCSCKNIPKFLYPSYVKTYLERDVRDLLNVKDMRLFNMFLKLCAGRIGSVFNASEIAGEIGVSSKTIQAWVSILQASYVVYLLPPYFENSRKRLTKSPKMYFCDTGLACTLLGIESAEQLAFDKMRGHLFENLIVVELLKRRLNEGKESNLYFYRDSNQNEVDILVNNGSSLDAIEVKSAMTYNPSFEKALLKVNEWVNPPVGKRTIIYAGTLEDDKGDIRLLNYRNM
ncbi:MAG: ATP-binding protein [Prevotella sp.]|nr:ATP-binding protein [Prevotella sp.]MDD6535572.1 ATP-binding protein [Prevotella sp.]MDD6994413.1 ATP-binding protein [Prevotella sp.]MDY3074257.1 ATP-binding protein [Prevotella sp.]